MERNIMLIIFLLFIRLGVSSQVTIGLDEEPVEGALLQLKNQIVNADGTNSDKGLLLPRVALDPAGSATGTEAQKLISSLKTVLPAGTSVNVTQHAGLMVYNMATQTVVSGAPFAETKICPGVYIWDGTQWVRTMKKECQ